MFDKTVIAEVISLNNAETGEYYVSYQQGKFKAYAPIELGFVYDKGTSVYVKIPGGDFSAKKLIEGQASISTVGEEEYDFMSSTIVEMGYSFEDDKTYSLLAGAQPDSEYYEKVIYEVPNYKEDATFISTFLAYPTIKFSADFKTDFKGDPLTGNYGLKIEFYTDQKTEDGTNITYTRKLETANFVGSLQEYITFSPQYAVYKIDNIKLTAVKKITFFQERYLKYDSLIDDKGNVLYENKTNPNIFVKNIKIAFVDNIKNNESLYYCGIQAPNGLSLIQDTDTIKLEGKFYYALKDVLDPKNCQCFWFKQNPLIVPGHEKYNQYAGGGWEEITDSNKVDFNKLTIKGSEVYQQLNYKFLVIYNNVMNFSSSVKVLKYYNDRFAVNKTSDSSGMYLELLDPRAENTVADWYIKLPDESYYQCADNTKKINISEYMIYPEILFLLSIPIENNQVVTYDYTLKNILTDADIRVTFGGIDTFMYDSNGDIINKEYNRELVITPIITTNASTIVTGITWYGPMGAQIFETTQTPNNSMMGLIRFNKATNAVHFIINPKYDSKRNMNTFQLKVETSTGNTYHFNKTINFFKQGDQEANGLTYNLLVKYCDEKGNEKSADQPLLFSKKAWNTIYLHPRLYADGKLIYNNSRIDNERTYKITYTVQQINVLVEQQILENNPNDYIYKVTKNKNDKLNAEGQYFVRFAVNIKIMKGDKEESSKNINFYQPILMAYGDIDLTKLTTLKFPKSVTYTEDGTAQPDNTLISVVYKGIEQTAFAIPESLNDNLKIVYVNQADGTTSYMINPTGEYKGANFPLDSSGETTKNMGAIKVRINNVSTSYIIQPIVMLLKSELNKGIDGYSGGVITVNNEKDGAETTKPVKPLHGFGKIDKDEETGIDEVFSSGMLFAQELFSPIIGLFGYDTDGTPTNSLKSDGSFSLGKGAIGADYDEDGNLQYSISDGFLGFLLRVLGLGG